MRQNFKDEHHIIHTKLEWESRPEGEGIRNTRALRPIIPRLIHNQIHANIPAVPLLPWQMIMQVSRTFRPCYDTLATIDSLCTAIERSGNLPKAHPIERHIGELAVDAIRLQIPYLKEALSERQYIA
jgi:hypothetical protein